MSFLQRELFVNEDVIRKYDTKGDVSPRKCFFEISLFY